MKVLCSHNVPDDLYNEVKFSAAESRRSMSREIQYLLKEALNLKSSRQNRRRRILHDVGNHQLKWDVDLGKYL